MYVLLKVLIFHLAANNKVCIHPPLNVPNDLPG